MLCRLAAAGLARIPQKADVIKLLLRHKTTDRRHQLSDRDEGHYLHSISTDHFVDSASLRYNQGYNSILAMTLSVLADSFVQDDTPYMKECNTKIH